MDAAIRAMIPFGFLKELVRAKVKYLLEEYGGTDGYPFIEADGYQVLIDAMLTGKEEENKEGEIKHGVVETSVKDDSKEGDVVDDHTVSVTAGPSRAGIDSADSEMPNSAMQSEKDEGYGNPVGDVPLHNPPVCSDQPSVASPSPPEAKRPRPFWWPRDGEEYKPPVIVYSPGKPIIPAEIVEWFSKRAEEDTPVMAPPPPASSSVAGKSKEEGDSQEPTGPSSRRQ